MEVTIREVGPEKTNVLDLKGDLDLYEAPEFKGKLKTLIEAGARKIIINLKDLRYIDSSGIGALISGLQQVYKTGGKFKLAYLHQDIRRTFELANLVKLFEIYPTDEDALKSL